MQFRVDSRRLPDKTRVPRKLRPLPAWTRHVSKTPDRKWILSIGGLFKTTWEINGRTFNPAAPMPIPSSTPQRPGKSSTTPTSPT